MNKQWVIPPEANAEFACAMEDTLASEVAAWQDVRNTQGGTVNWRFTTDDARIKLKRL